MNKKGYFFSSSRSKRARQSGSSSGKQNNGFVQESNSVGKNPKKGVKTLNEIVTCEVFSEFVPRPARLIPSYMDKLLYLLDGESGGEIDEKLSLSHNWSPGSNKIKRVFKRKRCCLITSTKIEENEDNLEASSCNEKNNQGDIEFWADPDELYALFSKVNFSVPNEQSNCNKELVNCIKEMSDVTKELQATVDSILRETNPFHLFFKSSGLIEPLQSLKYIPYLFAQALDRSQLKHYREIINFKTTSSETTEVCCEKPRINIPESDSQIDTHKIFEVEKEKLVLPWQEKFLSKVELLCGSQTINAENTDGSENYPTCKCASGACFISFESYLVRQKNLEKLSKFMHEASECLRLYIGAYPNYANIMLPLMDVFDRREIIIGDDLNYNGASGPAPIFQQNTGQDIPVALRGTSKNLTMTSKIKHSKTTLEKNTGGEINGSKTASIFLHHSETLQKAMKR